MRLSCFQEMRTITSQYREQKILDIVSDYSYKETGGGIAPREITRELKLKKIKMDERTVRRYLASLKAEGLVGKRKEIGHKWKYHVTRIYLQNESYFVYQMRRIGRKMIYPIWLKEKIIFDKQSYIPTYDSLPDIDTNRDANENVIHGTTLDELGDLHDKYSSSIYGLTEPEREFYKMMCRDDVTISSKYCQTKFKTKEEKERRVFEFVNRTGAFITYVFLKSLEALTKSNSKSMIDNAIDLQSFFKEFCDLFDIIITPALKDEDLQGISKAFRKVYQVGNILDKYWLDTMELSKRIKSLSK
jgi:hypothetical protein